VTFAVYAAPIVLSGDATFAGYIRLDDTATWMALTDRVMEHGRDLGGLAPSSYEATLAFNLADGYPVGVFLPLGVGQALVGEDVAWLIAPYMAWLAAILALALWTLAAPLVQRAWLRTVVAVLAAQSALLFGYYLWGGVKEVAAAALIASATGLIANAVGRAFSATALVPVAIVGAALIGVLSGGGILWLVPPLGLAFVLATLRLTLAGALGRAVLLAASIAAFSVPVLATGGLIPPTSSPLTDADARGNLLGALEPVQAAGVWPAGDFRLDPVQAAPAHVLIAVVVVAAAAGLMLGWRRRGWGLLAYAASGLGAGLMIYLLGSPWIDGKVLATAAPVLPFAAAVTAAWLIGSGREVEGAILLVAVGGGVLWSNALAYRDLNLAPRDQLVELERIGARYAGDGPALMTEYQPYGVRHFLRELDPEGASELRRREVALAGGASLRKGESADSDAFNPSALLPYRTLVLRRSPAQSRPPAAYRPAWRGEYYEVWQRTPATLPAGRRIGLGDDVQPVGRPDCDQVLALARDAAPGERLVAAARPPVVVVSLTRARYPRRWAASGAPSFPAPRDEGRLVASVRVARPGDYEIWLGGSVRPAAVLRVDGEPSGTVRHQLQNQGQYVRLGSAGLASGPHELAIEFSRPDLQPGSGGLAGSIGPLALSRAGPADATLVRVEPAEARTLCGRAWDWIELEG
jgi:hypothetical protein